MKKEILKGISIFGASIALFVVGVIFSGASCKGSVPAGLDGGTLTSSVAVTSTVSTSTTAK